jgi:hypothetical protein
MTDGGSTDYSDLFVRLPAAPEPEQRGSWWSHVWQFTVEEPSGGPLRLPPPPDHLVDMWVVVLCEWRSPTELVVDVLTRDRALTGDELAYVSVIAASLKKQLGESLAVEGRRDHPIFRMSRP